MAFVFDTNGQNFSFEAGQNIDVFLPEAPESGATSAQMHTFSFASAPQHQDFFMITTRMRDSKYKKTLKTLPLGTKLRCLGPNGNLVLHEDSSKPAVFLSGGIGITPFRSLIESSILGNLPHSIHVFYSNRTIEVAAFHDEFERWATQHPQFHYHPTLTQALPADWKYRSGKIDATMIRQQFGALNDAVFYVAGPEGMVSAMRSLLIDAGVSRDAIRLESFSGY